jgi:soluble lytic murein transglycosylase
MERPELASKIHQRSFGFIETIDFNSTDMDGIFQFEPGAGYLLAYHFLDEGRVDVYEDLLKRSIERDQDPWRIFAAEDLVRFLLNQERYREAEDVSSVLIKWDEGSARYRRDHLEALYWQQRDAEMLDLLALSLEWNESELSIFEVDELALFEAASSRRIGTPGWSSLFLSVFINQPISDLHIRAFDFLRMDPDISQSFTTDEWSAMEAMSLAARSMYSDAADMLPSLLRNFSLLTAQFILNTKAVFIGAKRLSIGIEELTSLRNELDSRALMDTELGRALHQSLGDLCRRLGRYMVAAGHYERALFSLGEESDDRLLWYWFDSLVKADPFVAAESILSLAEQWRDAAYFSDTLDELITSLFGRRAWDKLLVLEEELRSKAESYIQARLRFITNTLNRLGMIDTRPSVDREIVYDAATAFSAGYRLEYYTLLNTVMTGDELIFSSLGTQNDNEQTTDPSGLQTLISGLYRYDLPLYAYDRLNMASDIDVASVMPSTLTALAERLNEIGYYRKSLQVMDLYRRHEGALYADRILRYTHPRAFRNLIETIAMDKDVPPPLLFALVREESYFDPEARSHAGAMGLAQLMPATAQEVSARIGMLQPDLFNPDDNVRLGAEYLAYVRNYIGNLSHAVLAYNAGPGRIRSWESLYGDLPDELFFEAIPFRETRDYGRKLLTSSAKYGFLYYEISPAETVRLFFPHYP